MNTVMQSLSTRLLLQEPRCFTDSQIGLCWIIGTEKDWKPFVQNRVKEIRQLVPVECWSHCSGKTNPADIPSRGSSSAELSISELWRHGPSWLHEELIVPAPPTDIPEACAKELKSSNVCCLITSSDNPVHLSTIVDCRRYSSINSLFRVTAYVLQFISLLKGNGKSGQLTQNDFTSARRLWIADCQMTLMSDKNFPMWKSQFNLSWTNIDFGGVEAATEL